MITLSLYKFSGEKIICDKTKFLTNKKDLTGVLRDNTSVLSPVIMIEQTSDFNINQFNYCYIPLLGRYYFITDIVTNTNQLWTISLKVDTLMTYYDTIILQNAFVSRNEHEYNFNIKDGRIPFDYEIAISESIPTMIPTKTLTSFNTLDLDAITSYNYVLNVINETNFTTCENTPSPSNILPEISYNAFSKGFDYIYFLTRGGLNYITPQLINNDKLSSYIKSLVIFPFSIYKQEIVESNSIQLGSTTITDTGMRVLSSKTNQGSDYYNLAYFILHKRYGDFRDYSPYTQIELYLPYVGWIKLDTNNCYGNILVTYNVNFNDGSAQVLVTNESFDRLLYQSTCQLGVKIGLNTTNASEVQRNSIANAINLTMGMTSGVVSLATANPIGIIGGAMSTTKAIADYSMREMNNIERASGNVSSGYNGLYGPNQVRLRISTYKALFEPTNANFLKYNGGPLYTFKTLSELTGYTEVASIHLEGLSEVLDSEKDEIETLLKQGVIL